MKKSILLFGIVAFSLLSCNRDNDNNIDELEQNKIENDNSTSKGKLNIPSWLIGEWIANDDVPLFRFIFSNNGMTQILITHELNIGEVIKQGAYTIVEQKSSEKEYFLHIKTVEDNEIFVTHTKFKFVKSGNNKMFYHQYVGSSENTVAIEHIRKK